MTNSTDMMAPTGTTHAIKSEYRKSPLWPRIKALGNKCFYYNGTQWVDSLAENYLEYYLKFYDAVTHEEIPTETPEEAEAFNKIKPYEFDEHVSGKLTRIISNGHEPKIVSYTNDKPVFTQAMAEPSIGFKLKFNHDIDGKFSRLHDEKYGWEDGDDLEVIHITVNHDEEVCYIVLNCQPDVLNTAAITDLSFFDTRTPKQKAVDDVLAEWPVADAITLGVAYDVWNK